MLTYLDSWNHENPVIPIAATRWHAATNRCHQSFANAWIGCCRSQIYCLTFIHFILLNIFTWQCWLLTSSKCQWHPLEPFIRKTQQLFRIVYLIYPITSLSRTKIQKKTPSFPLLSPEGWSLLGVRRNPVWTAIVTCFCFWLHRIFLICSYKTPWNIWSRLGSFDKSPT